MTGFFHPEDTTPRCVEWFAPFRGGRGGFVIAALPTAKLDPVLIFFDVPDDQMSPPEIAELIRVARDTGAPHDVAAVFVYQLERGRNAPVSRVWTSIDGSTVVGFQHPSIAEEEFVIEQCRIAGVFP